MKKFKYFSIEELCRSTTADNKGIDNTPSPEIVEKLSALITNVLDPVRELYGGPIKVNSGYRCPALNKAVGGVATSQHQSGEAADITTGMIGSNKALFDLIRMSDIPYDQLINEKNGQWIHISFGPRNRKQVLYL